MCSLKGWEQCIVGRVWLSQLTMGRAAQASLLGAKKVKLPGPLISSLRFARSEYIWVVVAPTAPKVL